MCRQWIWFGSCLEQSCRFTSRDARSERKRLPRSILCFNNNLEDAQERREAWPDVFQSFCQNKTACGCVAGMGANEQFFEKVNTHPSANQCGQARHRMSMAQVQKNFNVLAFPSPVSTTLVKLLQRKSFERIFSDPMFPSKDKGGEPF